MPLVLPMRQTGASPKSPPADRRGWLSFSLLLALALIGAGLFGAGLAGGGGVTLPPEPPAEMVRRVRAHTAHRLAQTISAQERAKRLAEENERLLRQLNNQLREGERHGL